MADFSSKKQGTWFFFDMDNESLGGIQIRLLSPVEEERIERLTVKKKQKPVRGMMMETRTVDEKMKNRLTYDEWIVDWKNISRDGKSVSCNIENKMSMMEITDFARFVVDGVLSLSETNETIEKAKVKNLESSSDGKKQSPSAKDV